MTPSALSTSEIHEVTFQARLREIVDPELEQICDECGRMRFPVFYRGNGEDAEPLCFDCAKKIIEQMKQGKT